MADGHAGLWLTAGFLLGGVGVAGTARRFGAPHGRSDLALGAAVGAAWGLGGAGALPPAALFSVWIALPALAFAAAAAARRWVVPVVEIALAARADVRAAQRSVQRIGAAAQVALAAATGTAHAAAAGLVGKAAGAPLSSGPLLAAGGLAAGLLLFRVTAGGSPQKPPLPLSLLDGAAAALCAGGLVMAAAAGGLPTPVAPAVAAGFLGAAWAKRRGRGFTRVAALRLGRTLLAAPLFGLALGQGAAAAVIREPDVAAAALSATGKGAVLVVLLLALWLTPSRANATGRRAAGRAARLG